MMCKPVLPIGAVAGCSFMVGVGKPASWRSISQSPGRFECSDVGRGEARTAGVTVRGFRGNQDRTRCSILRNHCMAELSDVGRHLRRPEPGPWSRSVVGTVADFGRDADALASDIVHVVYDLLPLVPLIA